MQIRLEDFSCMSCGVRGELTQLTTGETSARHTLELQNGAWKAITEARILGKESRESQLYCNACETQWEFDFLEFFAHQSRRSYPDLYAMQATLDRQFPDEEAAGKRIREDEENAANAPRTGQIVRVRCPDEAKKNGQSEICFPAEVVRVRSLDLIDARVLGNPSFMVYWLCRSDGFRDSTGWIPENEERDPELWAG